MSTVVCCSTERTYENFFIFLLWVVIWMVSSLWLFMLPWTFLLCYLVFMCKHYSCAVFLNWGNTFACSRYLKVFRDIFACHNWVSLVGKGWRFYILQWTGQPHYNKVLSDPQYQKCWGRYQGVELMGQRACALSTL